MEDVSASEAVLAFWYGGDFTENYRSRWFANDGVFDCVYENDIYAL